MLTNVTRLESNINDKVFHLYCDPTSSLAEVRAALEGFEVIMKRIEESVAAQQAEVPQEELAELEPA